MVEPKKRNMKRSYVRTIKGKTKMHFKKRKASKQQCALCEREMHGMLHGAGICRMRNTAKTRKRPSTLLAGILCNKCRARAIEEAIKVKHNIKALNDVELQIRKYVDSLLNKIE